ncbi:hypothetical protein TREES_T100008365 [Tupaia chinensis]|uniref:Uncharacterized protein n=1 Tax=Tupaia chinensis TaxID=246437 RepID=L9LC34_TUPCH|nr:hypothetical protein TREES_T100008365 [Tupaia chinensis]
MAAQPLGRVPHARSEGLRFVPHIMSLRQGDKVRGGELAASVSSEVRDTEGGEEGDTSAGSSVPRDQEEVFKKARESSLYSGQMAEDDACSSVTPVSMSLVGPARWAGCSNSLRGWQVVSSVAGARASTGTAPLPHQGPPVDPVYKCCYTVPEATGGAAHFTS